MIAQLGSSRGKQNSRLVGEQRRERIIALARRLEDIAPGDFLAL